MSVVTAEAMYQMVAEHAGKNLRPGGLTKAMIAQHGEAACLQPPPKDA